MSTKARKQLEDDVRKNNRHGTRAMAVFEIRILGDELTSSQVNYSI